MDSLACFGADSFYGEHRRRHWRRPSRSLRSRSEAALDRELRAGAFGDSRHEEFGRDPGLVQQSARDLDGTHRAMDTVHAREQRNALILGRIEKPALDE